MKTSIAIALLFAASATMALAAEEEQLKSKDGKDIPAIEKLIELKGEAKKGKEVFYNAAGANCANCHQIGGEGKMVGPPLDTIGEKPKEVLFESILQPSAAIQHGFESWLIKTKSGSVKIGLLIEESEEQVTLRDANGDTTEIKGDDIAKKVKQEKSMMPEGLAATVSLQDLVDLVEFLSTLKVQK